MCETMQRGFGVKNCLAVVNSIIHPGRIYPSSTWISMHVCISFSSTSSAGCLRLTTNIFHFNA